MMCLALEHTAYCTPDVVERMAAVPGQYVSPHLVNPRVAKFPVRRFKHLANSARASPIPTSLTFSRCPSAQLDSFLRVTEGLPLQDDGYTWLVRNFACRSRPTIIDTTVSGIPKKERVSKTSMCLTKRGFLQMYKFMWQASGRDTEVSKGVV